MKELIKELKRLTDNLTFIQMEERELRKKIDIIRKQLEPYFKAQAHDKQKSEAAKKVKSLKRGII